MKKSKTKRKASLLYVMIQTMIELLTGLKYSVVEELGKIAVVVEILIPIMIAKTGFGIIGLLILSCLLNVIVKYIKEVGYRMNHVTERGFPIPARRYTRKDENGFINIREEETQEATLYLCEVEDYLKSKGWL